MEEEEEEEEEKVKKRIDDCDDDEREEDWILCPNRSNLLSSLHSYPLYTLILPNLLFPLSPIFYFQSPHLFPLTSLYRFPLLLQSFRVYTQRQEMCRLRGRSCRLKEEINDVFGKIEEEVALKRIMIRRDKKVHADLGEGG